MAKRKDLLLTESTTMRMMGLAGIGSLANPFLKENYDDSVMNEIEYDELPSDADQLPCTGTSIHRLRRQVKLCV